MQEIIATLSQIDNKSAKIMEAAAREVKKLDTEATQRKEKYLAYATKKTDEELADLRKELKAEEEKELAAVEAESKLALQSLEDNYVRNHAAISDRIFKSIIS
ncbi:MAG: hypothetical protein ACI4EV_01770 [Lachnospiraceae bacterium]